MIKNLMVAVIIPVLLYGPASSAAPGNSARKIRPCLDFAESTAAPETTPNVKIPEDNTESDKPEKWWPGKKKETALVGKAAPVLDLESADGRLDLATHKGRNVVVLFFWNSFYPLCSQTIPEFGAISEEYKGKNVLFCLVNQGESSGKARRFLEKEKLLCVSAFDPVSGTAESFLTESFPQIVVIDREGTVRAVHSGKTDGLKDVLKKDIEPLLKENDAPLSSAIKE